MDVSSMMQSLFSSLGLQYKSCIESFQLHAKLQITRIGVVLKKISPVKVLYPFTFWVHEFTWRISKDCDLLTSFVNSQEFLRMHESGKITWSL